MSYLLDLPLPLRSIKISVREPAPPPSQHKGWGHSAPRPQRGRRVVLRTQNDENMRAPYAASVTCTDATWRQQDKTETVKERERELTRDAHLDPVEGCHRHDRNRPLQHNTAGVEQGWCSDWLEQHKICTAPDMDNRVLFPSSSSSCFTLLHCWHCTVLAHTTSNILIGCPIIDCL